jgi:hypothetical protein
MPVKPIELPPELARRFVDAMRAFYAEPNTIRQDEIAGRQMHVLQRHQPPRAKKLRIPDLKEMFAQMRGHLGE